MPGQDEPRYDLTAAAEDVVRWVESLSGRDFVATQSRLTSIFAVLKALVQQSETDPEVRLAELQRQRDGIDAEMKRIRDGNISVMTAPEALDHFQQLTTLAKDLLSDFREVEQNFRKLDRQVREQIATWDGTQGELLASIFANQQDISGSLQGRTFQGFWDYLMSPQLRTELRDLLQRATQIDALAELDNLHAVTNLHQDWLPAVEQTQATVRQLSQQMRRLLDDKVFLENKRIMQLVRSIESGALGTREVPPSGVFMEIAAQSVDVALPFERPLYEPSRRIMVDDVVVAANDADVDAGALFSQFHVDTERLRSNIDDVLAGAEQATLGRGRERPSAVAGPGRDCGLLPARHRIGLGLHQPGRVTAIVLAAPGRQHPGSHRRTDHLREARMTPTDAPETHTPEELPGVVTKLFKGVVYAESDEKTWQSLLGLASHVRDYVAVLGLT